MNLRAENELETLLEVLENTPTFVVLEHAEDWESDDKPPTPAAGEKFRIPGSIVSFVERLDDELTRSLQHIDPHTAEYIDRLRDEQALYTMIVRGLLYAENLVADSSLESPSKANQESVNRILMRRLEHIYFKVYQLNFCVLVDTHDFIDSRLKSSKSSRRIPGMSSQRPSTPLLHLVVKQQIPKHLSIQFAPTFTSIAKALFGPEPCLARFISWRYTTNTFELAI